MFLDKIKAQTHTQEDLETMQTFAKVMPMSSLCGLGETAQNALKSAMKIFPDTFKIKTRRHWKLMEELINLKINNMPISVKRH